MVRRRGIVRSAARTAGRTAVIAGTATAVSGRVAQRQHENLAARQTEPAAVPVQATGRNDIVEGLAQLAELRASGALSEKEFTTAKERLLKG